MNAYRINGHAIKEKDGMRWGERWFNRMILPRLEDVAGPFTPIEIARHRAWGLRDEFNRLAVYAPMQDTTDTYNGGFWPMTECDPSEVIPISAKYGKIQEACVFTYDA